MPRYTKGEPIHEQPENLTIFGGWFYYFCRDFHVSLKEVARRADMDHSILSKNTRFSASGEVLLHAPKRKTIERIVHVFAQLAEERSKAWTQEDEEAIYNAAGFSTPEEIEQSRQLLIARQHPEK
ncbi:MAG TPA: hypothetical protein VGN34_15525 [Ktedonobacteraceae bacterium]